MKIYRGAPEYCVALWTKAGFNWADWGCNLRVSVLALETKY